MSFLLNTQLEVEKKKMDVAAMTGMQNYLKQMISLSLLQEELKTKSKFIIEPMSAIPSIARMNAQLEEFNQLIQKNTQKPADIQVKCEEEPVQKAQVKVEHMEEEQTRKSDSESRNSCEIEHPTQGTCCRPLFDIFPHNKRQLVCPHPWRKHHAKGLCKQCYEKYGRTKKPTHCEHDVHFARGYCKKCYFKVFKKSNRYDAKIYNELKMKLCSIKKRI